MSGQLESPHFFQTGDTVRAIDGSLGTVVEGESLYALIEWRTGAREELDQFDPRVLVVQRAEET
ncbi:MAG: hypothetical protein WD737_11975 [Gemmatimonadota bacterium]